MITNILNFFKSVPASEQIEDKVAIDKLYQKHRRNIIFVITIGYAFYYTCRLGLSIAKKPLIDSGMLTADQLGQIGAAMFYGYAFGKFINGFMADYVDVRKLFAAGLLISVLCNFAFGFSSAIWVFILVWMVNGWFQGVGVGCCVVSLANWFVTPERGRYYGIWSTAHSVGEGMTYLGGAALVGWLGWRAGFIGPAIICIFVAVIIYWLMRDRPASYGLPTVAQWKGMPVEPKQQSSASTFSAQMQIFKKPALWIICLACATMYITRYAISSWGMLFLQEAKGCSIISAGGLLGINTGLSIVGGVSYGFISDKLFKGRRPPVTLFFGVLEIVALMLIFIGYSRNYYYLAMAFGLFGFSIGGLLVGLGGLLAVDIVSKKATGAALGFIGIFSYIATAIQEHISGYLIEKGTCTINGVTTYDFTAPVIFWLVTSIVSLLLGLLVWNVRQVD